jgi:peptidoglycan/LPS O-acetylase OafA/YrhL
MRAFYGRRAVRLLPALVFFLTCYLVYSAIDGWPPFGDPEDALGSTAATLGYVMNWYTLFRPYDTADLGPLWSLSIEEQFYLIWPVAILFLFGVTRSVRVVVFGIGGLAVAVIFWRMWLFDHASWQDAYLRTDARFDGLLIGALTAWLWVRGYLPTRLPRATVPVIAAIYVWILWVVRADGGATYRGLLTVWHLGAAVMIVALVSRPAPLRNPLTRALGAIGTVSYALYLWQQPVIKGVGRHNPGWSTPVTVLVILLILGACVTASWYLVERPTRAWRRRFERRVTRPESATPPAVASTG